MINYARRSLDGVWVGDCIGNLGQLYFAHDILKALEEGMAKYGGQLNQFHKQFQYSDDTEEAIVLYNHLLTHGRIDQDKLAMGFATRYMERDPDGEIFGYGLNTRKVLRDIYEGVPWKDANKIIKKSEGMPSHIDSLVDSLAHGEGFHAAMENVQVLLEKQRAEQLNKTPEGSCGNGSAMRVAPLGAYLLGKSIHDVITMARLQSEVTHCHPEGVAGAIAISLMAKFAGMVAADSNVAPVNRNLSHYYSMLLEYTPPGKVRDGIVNASNLLFNTPIPKLIEVLGNGTHVTCQDTVPLCCFMAIKHLSSTPVEEMYEKAIIETSMCFGDVDTNCAIVGGIVGIVSPPPQKWVQFCQPMEGVI